MPVYWRHVNSSVIIRFCEGRLNTEFLLFAFQHWLCAEKYQIFRFLILVALSHNPTGRRYWKGERSRDSQIGFHEYFSLFDTSNARRDNLTKRTSTPSGTLLRSTQRYQKKNTEFHVIEALGDVEGEGEGGEEWLECVGDISLGAPGRSLSCGGSQSTKLSTERNKSPPLGGVE